MYGSILHAVTLKPRNCSILPIEDVTMPFPKPEMTPPVMKMYLVCITYIFSHKNKKTPIDTSVSDGIN